jgi:hypothetical protein
MERYDRAPDGERQILYPASKRRPWRTPQVIEETLADTKNNDFAGSDGAFSATAPS